MAKRKPKTVKGEIVLVNNDLTIKQRLFIDHYIICTNATEAARRAGYEGDYSTLANTGSQNLKNPYILRELESRLNSVSMMANEVLMHITEIGRSSMADAVNPVGGIDINEAVRRGKAGNIKRYKTKFATFTDKDGNDHESEETEIEMYDRLDALKTLAKFHSLLVNRIQVDDWHSQAIADIKAGHVTFEMLANGFDHQFATELFTAAGVQIPIKQE